MYNIHNHMIFLDSDARNALHEGKEVEGQGFLTVIDMEAKKLDFSTVDELVCRYKINSCAKISAVSFDEESESKHISINFNSDKLKIDMDEILDISNEGKEKIVFSIVEKNAINYICLSDISLLKNNYVFIDDINNFSEQEKI